MPISSFHPIIFSLKKYCSESNIHYIYRNMLWLSDMLNTEGKNIIFPEEGGKVRRANQRQPVH